MGVLAHAYPPLGAANMANLIKFLRFCRSLAFHSYVYLREVNKPTGNIHSTSGRLQGRAEWGCWHTLSPARGPQTWPI